MVTQEVLLSIDMISVRVEDRKILDRVSCSVLAGEVVGILGPNGAGKSTLLHAIVGLMPTTSGSITVEGHPSHTSGAKSRIGWVPDDLPMPDSLTGLELSRLHERLRGQCFDRHFCDELFEIVGLSGDLNRPCGDYSHGMRRKLSLVISLSHRPRLLILDEPFRGLDPATSALLRIVIDRYRSGGQSVLMATHDLVQASDMSDRVFLIDQGKILASGSPSRLCIDSGVDHLEDAFLQLTGQDQSYAMMSERLRGLLRYSQ